MGKERFRVGSIAVLFAVVVLCVAVFGTLTAVTAISDERVARRYGEHVTETVSCRNLGQQWLAQTDGYLAGKGELPENSWVEGDLIGTEIVEGSRHLTILIRAVDDGYEIQQWSCTTQWQPEETWNLWK